MNLRTPWIRTLPLYLFALAATVSVSAGGIAAVLILVTAAAFLVRERGRAALPPRPVLWSLGALVGAYALATALAGGQWYKLWEESWLKLLLVAVPVVAGPHRRHAARAMRTLLMAGLVAAGYACWQHFSGRDPIRDRDLLTEWGHVAATGFTGHPLSLGGQLVVLIPPTMAWFVAEPWRRRRLWLLPLLALYGLALLWSYARSPLLGTFAACVVMVLLLRGRRRWMGLGLLAAPCLALPLVPGLLDHLRRLLVLLQHVTRLNLWRSSLAGIADRPLLGWGPGNFGAMMARHEVEGFYNTRAHSHNDLLMHAVNAGLLGLAAALALLVTVTRELWRGWRRGGDHAWVLLGALGVQAGITVAGFFQVYQTDDEVEMLLYFVLGCALVLARRPAEDCQADDSVRHWPDGAADPAAAPDLRTTGKEDT